MSRIKINSSLLSDIYLAHGAIGCFAFTFETKEEDSQIHARFFAPDDNIAEDPATGSAAGALRLFDPSRRDRNRINSNHRTGRFHKPAKPHPGGCYGRKRKCRKSKNRRKFNSRRKRRNLFIEFENRIFVG